MSTMTDPGGDEERGEVNSASIGLKTLMTSTILITLLGYER